MRTPEPLSTTRPPRRPHRTRQGVCLVGPGKRFLSGLTYYTYALAEALADPQLDEGPSGGGPSGGGGHRPLGDVSVILLRQLLPSRFYPGAERVGADLSHLRLSPWIRRYDGVDWFWLPSLLGAIWFLARRRPAVLLVQWWTAAALHTQLALALAARVLGARVVVEMHEVLDPGEDSMGWVRRYSRLVAPLLFRLSARVVVHSHHDVGAVGERYGLRPDEVDVVPHLVHAHYHVGHALREAPEGCVNLLYLGVIRPFKGVEDLIDAFDALPPEEIDSFWLTVVGETWEGWTVPNERIAASRHRDRITFVNRYVSDADVDGWFSGADAVVLPYHRSSMSGPLHVAMSYGLPVVVSRVGGLTEAAGRYAGALLVEPRDPAGLTEALRKVATMASERFGAADDLWFVERHYAEVFRRAGVGPA